MEDKEFTRKNKEVDDPRTDREKARATLEKPTEGFIEVLDWLDGVDRSDGFKRINYEPKDSE